MTDQSMSPNSQPQRAPSPAELMAKHGVSARKSWGQNFLHDPHIVDRIVAAAAATQPMRIVEIGAGLGAITHRLVELCPVWAIERDRDLCEVLRNEFSSNQNFSLHEADAVKFNYESAREGLAATQLPTIVGNLPYQLTGPLLFKLLESHEHTGPWIVMIQREVADRLTAEPGSRTYGGATAAISRERSIQLVTRVPPGCFTPAPRVQSCVIRLDPRPQPLGEVAQRKGYLQLVRSAFQGRRKTLRNSLAQLADKARVESWCASAGIDPSLRPERLGPEQFAALQRARERDAEVD